MIGYEKKTMEYYQEAERLDPNDPVVYTNIGALYVSRGMYAEARPYFEKRDHDH
ncbi:MAG: hypothetical protein K5746_11110 [Clostridiales bacterium]|nr:hypothetical protein [Clostridiales bacterium]